VDWRREDTGYAAAAVAIVGFVVYLLAANFGLVPSPLAPLADAAPAAVAAIEAPPDVIATSETIPPPPPTGAVHRASASHPPATAEVADTARPAVTVSTKDGTSIGLTAAPTVSGVAKDVGTGIDKVDVRFATDSGSQVVPADITCSSDHHSCTWTAKVPAVLASYKIAATAYDRAGNLASSTPIDMTVVNTGGTVEQLGKTVGRVPGIVGGIAGALLNVLGLGGR